MSDSDQSQTIPTLDLRRFDGTPEERAEFVRDLKATFTGLGFAGFSGHGIPDELRDRAFAAIKAFFDQPLDVKRRYAIEGGAGQRGYTGFGVEKAKDQDVGDLKEFWHVGPENVEGAVANLWPEEVEGFRDDVLALYDALTGVGDKVLRAIALGLDLPEDYFVNKVDKGDTILRPLHYPPLKDDRDERAIRAASHEDINVITLLVGSNEPGLEILKADGQWLGVTTLPGAIVCNVGDMLQRLTNHELVSTTHRVVNPPEPWASQPRYSVPYFLHFNDDFEIATLPQCVTEARPNRYPEPITAGDYLRERLREIGLM